MEIVGALIWAGVLWLVLRALWRRFTGSGASGMPSGAPPARPEPPRSTGSAPRAPEPPPDSWRQDGAFFDGAFLGGYLTHRHYRDRMAEQEERHARELDEIEADAWLLHGDEVAAADEWLDEGPTAGAPFGAFGVEEEELDAFEAEDLDDLDDFDDLDDV
jgi:hypothetical protein